MILTYIQLYFIGLCFFVVVDFLWLFFVTPHFILKGKEGVTEKEASQWHQLFYFYALFVLGLLLFAVFFLLEDGQLHMVMLRGLLFGLFVYSFYNLITKKESKKFTASGSTFDLLWGGLLSSLVAGASYLAYFHYLD